MASKATPRRIGILVYPGVQSLDVTGPLEVFHGAGQLVQRSGRDDAGYEITTIARNTRPVATSSGLRIAADTTLARCELPLDTLIVAGGSGRGRAEEDRELLGWLRQAASRARRTASVCTGAFLLARAGLLDGRRVTTHWASAAELQREHPEIEVDAEPIFIRDGALWTSAGVTAGMDLALAMVEEDLDREAALTIARHLVLFLRRPGGQRQFSATLAAQQPGRQPLREVQRAVVEELAGDHTVSAMAARADMSERHFARAFQAETGLTPARFVEAVRVEAARRRLEESTDGVAAIAAACGFGTTETMRRAFVRSLGVGPADYRSRFRGGASLRPAA